MPARLEGKVYMVYFIVMIVLYSVYQSDAYQVIKIIIFYALNVCNSLDEFLCPWNGIGGGASSFLSCLSVTLSFCGKTNL